LFEASGFVQVLSAESVFGGGGGHVLPCGKRCKRPARRWRKVTGGHKRAPHLSWLHHWHLPGHQSPQHCAAPPQLSSGALADTGPPCTPAWHWNSQAPLYELAPAAATGFSLDGESFQQQDRIVRLIEDTDAARLGRPPMTSQALIAGLAGQAGLRLAACLRRDDTCATHCCASPGR
jgi:hypothetical protein